jgi:hypothetical protein
MRNRYINEIIMKKEEYYKMKKIVIEKYIEVVRDLDDICNIESVNIEK